MIQCPLCNKFVISCRRYGEICEHYLEPSKNPDAWCETLECYGEWDRCECDEETYFQAIKKLKDENVKLKAKTMDYNELFWENMTYKKYINHMYYEVLYKKIKGSKL